MKNTKSSFHTVIKKKFCRDYQPDIFDKTFLKKFENNDSLKAEAITYQMIKPVDKDMYQWIIKFCRACDCNFFTTGGEIHFLPIFSEVKKTYWEHLVS